VVHEVRDARNAERRHWERLDERRLGLRRRRDRHGAPVVEVVGEPHPNSALGSADQRGANRVDRLGAEPEVVQSEVEARARTSDELGDCVGDLESRLASVVQQAELEAVPVGRY
jgi:hypothetical protein